MADVAPGPSGFPGPGPAPVVPGQGGFGTVSSVGLTMPTQFGVTNSPVTSTGNIGVTWNSQAANLTLASPNGAAGLPTFRQLVPADIGSGPATVAFTPTLTIGGTLGDGVFSGVTATGNIRQIGPLVWFIVQVTFTFTFTTASGQFQVAGWPVSPQSGIGGYFPMAISPSPASPYSLIIGTLQNTFLVGTIYGTGQAGNLWGPGFGLVSGTAYRILCGGVYITQ